MEDRHALRTPRPLVFGEVLFDHFPDGAAVLGGAPFNVAWHLQGFGLDPLFVSRVGDDTQGREVRRAMTAWGLDDAGLQLDADRPTGRVSIVLEDGQPTFDIRPDQAYDAVDAGEAVATAGARPCSLMYHGTLALRGETARTVLGRLREAANPPIFLDVNLRPPWYDRETVVAGLDGARWAKLNEAELHELSEDGGDLEAAAAGLARTHGLEAVIVTLGADGAVWAFSDGILATTAAEPVAEIVDTVGAGDAFASVCITGLLLDMPAERILRSAHGFAAEICGIRGAVARDPKLYTRAREDWR